MYVNTPSVSLFSLFLVIFRLLQELHFSEWEFSIYFVGYCDEADIPSETKERTRWCFQQVRALRTVPQRFSRRLTVEHNLCSQDISCVEKCSYSTGVPKPLPLLYCVHSP